MQVEFMRAAKFPHASELGKELFFSKGIHEVPEHVIKHPYFKLLLEDGLVVEPEAAKLSVQESLLERKQKLAAKALAPKVSEPVAEDEESKKAKKSKR